MSPSGKISEAMVEAGARALATKHYVERFNEEPGSRHVQMNVDGNWHIFADDAQTALTAALSVPAPGTGGAEAPYQGTVCEHGIRWPWACHDCDRIALARRDVSTQQGGDLGAVKVRDLEWEAVSQVEARAPGGFGDDYICYRSGAQVCLDLPDGKTTIHTSFEAAKAAAQQDYESRILSALSSTPVGEMDGATIEACAQIAETDQRSPMAKKTGHKPEWHKHGLSIAKRIRNLAPQGGR